MALRSHYAHSLDSKHRLSIPASYRPAFSDGLVLAKDSDGCVAVWTPQAHESTVERALAGRNPLGGGYKRVQRYFQSNSWEMRLDASGRITLPAALLEHAEIDRDVVVAGVGDHLEVWASERWAAVQAELDADIGEVTESLGDPS